MAMGGVGSAPGSWEQVYVVVRSTGGGGGVYEVGIEVPQLNECDDSK